MGIPNGHFFGKYMKINTCQGHKSSIHYKLRSFYEKNGGLFNFLIMRVDKKL
jgi:hypothetical protein